ncbi:MAG TPA: phosphomannomutase/phosphoglucomutase [Acidobacteriota bacterium]|nr:phosphomannomutase/phosphoglucomutase [Acidobacteriota bacterium]
MQVRPNIFREYDIRGLVEKELTDETALGIAKAFGTYIRRLGKKKLSLGRDVRLTSDRFAEIAHEGLSSTGCDVIDIGVVPTPLLYFSLFQLPVDGGLMITASHNPSEYNGFKLCVGTQSIYGEEIQKIRKTIEADDFITGQGSVSNHPGIIDTYKDYMRQHIQLERPVYAAIDCGNGTASLVAPDLIRSLGCKTIELFCTPDGRFPNHHPDPTDPHNLVDLIAAVKKEKAEVGLAYDGDSDRLGVIDDKGNILWGDQLLIIFARDTLSRKPNSTVIFEVKCSKTLEEDIKKHAGSPIMWKAGHSLIKSKMKETHAAVAGEMSGHLFFADEYFGYDDAIYASLRMLRILSNTNLPLSEFLRDVPKTYSTPELRVDCPDDKKFKVVETVTGYYRGKYPIVDVDGVRVNFGDGWGLVRASNTQPALVLRFEADSPERLNVIQAEVEAVVKSYL